MDIGSLFLILALLVLVGLFISRPFFERKPDTHALTSSAQDHDLSHWLAEHDRILNALQELDFDASLGKIPAEDYPAQRLSLLQYGADVLRKLDAYQQGGAREDAEARLEAAIAARRVDGARRISVPQAVAVANGGNGNGGQVEDDDLEALLATRRRARQEKSAGFCPKCGGPVQKSDRFCPKCGALLDA